MSALCSWLCWVGHSLPTSEHATFHETEMRYMYLLVRFLLQPRCATRGQSRDGRSRLTWWEMAGGRHQKPRSISVRPAFINPYSCCFSSAGPGGEESRGSVNQKVAPRPGVLSTPTCPCCLLISCWQI